MRYFLMEADNKSPIPQLFNINNEIDIRNINRENVHRIPMRSLVEMRSRSEVFYPDVLSNPFFIVSKECSEVIGMYETNIIYRYLKLYCKDSEENVTYYLPILEEVECLDEKSEFNLNRSLITKMILNREAIGERVLFRIAGFSKSYIIARMDMVESILRRGALALKLTEVEVYSKKAM